MLERIDSPVVIWKFPVKVGAFEVKAPFGLHFLSIGHQDNEPVFWARVNPAETVLNYRFWTLMTGEKFPDELAKDPHGYWEFRGTVQLIGDALGNPFVLHLFAHRCPNPVQA